MSKSKFVVKSKTKIKDLIDGTVTELPTSDLSIEEDGHIVQLSLEREEGPVEKVEVFPGYYDIKTTQAGFILPELEMKDERLMADFANTKGIIKEFDNFFGRLEIYDELGLEKRRGLLMYGPQGTGKSKSIMEAVKQLREKDEGLVVINWDTQAVESQSIMTFYKNACKFTEKCTKQVIIIEDIGMNVESYGGPKQVDSTLLNFLDGIGVKFQVPTLIVATTNYAHNLPANLVDRPGRFDEWIEVGPPSATERVILAEFISDKEISESDKEYLMRSEHKDLTIAHIKEIVIRSKVHDISLEAAMENLNKHRKLFKNGFEKEENRMGF